MNFTRLENLIVALRDARPEAFNMSTYAHGCGSPACVFGHYCARRDLQSEFMLSAWGWPSTVSAGTSATHRCRVVREHFGIDRAQADELFGYDDDSPELCGCAGAKLPSEAIAYIRAFIDRHRALVLEEGSA